MSKDYQQNNNGLVMNKGNHSNNYKKIENFINRSIMNSSFKHETMIDMFHDDVNDINNENQPSIYGQPTLAGLLSLINAFYSDDASKQMAFELGKTFNYLVDKTSLNLSDKQWYDSIIDFYRDGVVHLLPKKIFLIGAAKKALQNVINDFNQIKLALYPKRYDKIIKDYRKRKNVPKKYHQPGCLHAVIANERICLVAPLIKNCDDFPIHNVEQEYTNKTVLHILVKMYMYDNAVHLLLDKAQGNPIRMKNLLRAINSKDIYGRTPLHFLAIYGKIDLYNKIKSYNSTIAFLKDGLGKTPEDYLKLSLDDRYKYAERSLKEVGLILDRDVNSATNKINGYNSYSFLQPRPGNILKDDVAVNMQNIENILSNDDLPQFKINSLKLIQKTLSGQTIKQSIAVNHKLKEINITKNDTFTKIENEIQRELKLKQFKLKEITTDCMLKEDKDLETFIDYFSDKQSFIIKVDSCNNSGNAHGFFKCIRTTDKENNSKTEDEKISLVRSVKC